MSEALELAVAAFRAPPLGVRLHAQPLPGDVLDVIRIAAGDRVASEQGVAATGLELNDLREASTHYLQLALFCEHADSYRTLGVPPDASAMRLKEHYRWLMHWLHPDRDRAAEFSVFSERVNRAWNDLRTPTRREAYDQFLNHRAALVAIAEPVPWTGEDALGLDRRSHRFRQWLSGRTVRRLPAIVVGSSAALVAALAVALWVLHTNSDYESDLIDTASTSERAGDEVAESAPPPRSAARSADNVAPAVPAPTPAPSARTNETGRSSAADRATAAGASGSTARTSAAATATRTAANDGAPARAPNDFARAARTGDVVAGTSATDGAARANASDIAPRTNATDGTARANAIDIAARTSATDGTARTNANDIAARTSATDGTARTNANDVAARTSAIDGAARTAADDIRAAAEQLPTAPAKSDATTAPTATTRFDGATATARTAVRAAPAQASAATEPSAALSAARPIDARADGLTSVSTLRSATAAEVESALARSATRGVAPSASAVPLPRVPTPAQAQGALARMQDAYREGDLHAMMDLFAAGESDPPRSAVETQYADLFRKSRERSLVLRNVGWLTRGDVAVGLGEYETVVIAREGDRPHVASGTIRIELRLEDGQARIVRLRHDRLSGS